MATADTRTVYYYSPDFDQPVPNTHDYVGAAWPYVYTDGSLTVDAGISAAVATLNDGVGDFITINDLPLYQFINDMVATDALGNFGPWFFVEPDGTATQEVVSEPGTASLLGLGLVALAARRRS